jgi:hypothetical protein
VGDKQNAKTKSVPEPRKEREDASLDGGVERGSRFVGDRRAKTLGLDVTAEGVETVMQEAELRVLGVEHGQGYLFARPQPAEQVEGLLFGQPDARDSRPAA